MAHNRSMVFHISVEILPHVRSQTNNWLVFLTIDISGRQEDLIQIGVASGITGCFHSDKINSYREGIQTAIISHICNKSNLQAHKYTVGLPQFRCSLSFSSWIPLAKNGIIYSLLMCSDRRVSVPFDFFFVFLRMVADSGDLTPFLPSSLKELISEGYFWLLSAFWRSMRIMLR